MIRLATVSPCYNEEEVLAGSADRLTALFRRLIAEGIISENSMIVFVNDGSTDSTWNTICRLQSTNRFVRGINLSYNVGHQNALMAGMMTARKWADAVITIDADLQDDLEAVPKMIAEFEHNGCDVVYGVKTSRRADPVLKRMTAMAFYRLQHALGVDSIYNHADFRLLSRHALDLLAGFGERNLYLRGLVPMLGLPSATVEDVIGPRPAGQSKYTLRKMLRLALDGICSFSVKPIYLIMMLGILFFGMGVLIGVYVIHALINGTAHPGWASVMMSIWIVGGLILFALGVVGVYIGKIYTEVKARPLYQIREIIGVEEGTRSL